MHDTQSVRVDKQIVAEISKFSKETGLSNVAIITRMWEFYKGGKDYSRLLLYPRKAKEEANYDENY